MPTNGSQGNTELGDCIVQYVHNDEIIKVVPDQNALPILLVADEIMANIVERIEILEGNPGGIIDITTTINHVISENI